MSKGSRRRAPLVSQSVIDANWAALEKNKKKKPSDKAKQRNK